MARVTRKYTRAWVLSCWFTAAWTLPGCADVLGLAPAESIPSYCIAARDCPPDWSCTNSQCVSNVCAASGQSQCNGLELLTCDKNGKWKKDPEKCASRCEVDHCVKARSCKLLDDCGEFSCCDSIQVEKASFQLAFEVPEQVGDKLMFPRRSVSRSLRPFTLDRFEVTVGRFNAFVADYEAARHPQPGAGKHPGFADSGWQERWNDAGGPLPQNARTLVMDLLVRGERLPPDGDQRLPVRGVNWYLAEAFCIWDGGRLPTEAEWAYAAGGDDDRQFPWSADSDPPITVDRAVYSGDALMPEGPAPVGEHPGGRGPLGHEDLAGNVKEWVADVYTDTLPATCQGPSDTSLDEFECLQRGPNDADRVLRGGAYDDPANLLRNLSRFYRAPFEGKGDAGIRCARDLSAATL